MGPTRILLLAEPYERDGLRVAVAAAGGVALAAEPHDDLPQVIAAARADAVVLAGGPALREPAATARRVRALAGARTPIVFVGEASELVAVEQLVDAAFRRPVPPGDVIGRALALTRAPAEAPAEMGLEAAGGLRKLAAGIDDALNAEMLSAIRTVTDPLPPPAPPAPAPVEPLSTGAVLAPPDAMDDLWELLGREDAAAWLPAAGDSAPRLSGELADVDAPLLLGRIFNAGTTGRLVVASGAVERSIYFEAGRPVYAASNHADDRLIGMLVRQGRLTPAQHHTAMQAAKETGRKMGALLVDLGLMETSDLLPAIRQHYEELVFALFDWGEGRWRIEPGVMASPTQIRLLRHPAALVRAGLRRAYGKDRLWQRLGSPRNVFSIDVEGRAAEVLGELGATAEERRLPMLFDGVRPLGEVVRLSGLPEEEAVALVFALSSFSLLRATVAGERGAVRDREIERERILARHALAMEGDYFEVLGVARTATPEEIRRAHELVCRDLAPARLGPELARTMARELDTLREVIEEALRVLGTDALRSRYQSQLPRLERSSVRG